MIRVRKTDTAMIFALVAAQNAYAKSLNSTEFHYDASADVEDPGTDYQNPAESVLIIDAAAASDLATLVALANEIVAKMTAHFADADAHDIADTANFTAAATAVATNLATANTRLNAVKVDLNAHYSEAGVHPNNDGTNTIAAANATDQGSGETLANEIRTDMVAHIASQSAGVLIQLV